ncbi:beta-galactosidase [Alteromonas macleodii]|uniref:beta-galactosidase n=1 Tax=Alteromonas macleodii TaxID=28108 RepID=UPI002076BACF|nr:beta-galactosidase [Alteromonas macleodii]USI26465.1 beta-galactosidase [Alteromonas macleodii]
MTIRTKFGVVATCVLAAVGLQSCAKREAYLITDTKELASQHESNTSHDMLESMVKLNENTKSLINANAVDWQISTADDGERQLNIKFNAALANKPSLTINAESTWDFSLNDTVAVVMDIDNPSSEPVHLHVALTDVHGKKHNRNSAIPPHSSASYYSLIKGENVSLDTGMRSNPKHWDTDYTQLIWRTGSKEIDVSKIKSITFQVMGVMADKYITVRDIRAVRPTSFIQDSAKHIVDEFGQNNKIDFEGKVTSIDNLRQHFKEESVELQAQLPTDRSKFGGYLNGPKLESTGYFRTEKHDGKWALVDPEGYLFFSTGIANVRMANTSTITGFDVPDAYVKSRVSTDLTPEDSMGLNRLSNAAAEHRFEASAIRANMFTSLPDYNEDLGNFYGYRRSVHTGTIDKGETYSYYMANLARKFGDMTVDGVLDKWESLTVKRMQSWGFTSFGNWIDTRFYDNDNFPYFANGWIIGDFKTVSSGNDYWAPIPDPFDKKFAERTDATVKQIALEVKNSPWCVGVFIDNEKSWGIMGSPESQFGLVAGTMALNASNSPAKTAFVEWLKNRYENIQTLNKNWGVSFVSFDELNEGFAINFNSTEAIQDYSELLTFYAEAYFKTVADSMGKYMPNHLYMGARFADWGMTPELRSAAARHVDVMSYNYYREGINPVFWHFLEELDMPSIIGEFHMGALDSGLFNPGLIGAHTQELRGQMYETYMNSVIDNPYFVGAHWFQYIDSPIAGRAYDGENYNVGFVSVADIPYKPFIKSVKRVNNSLYQRRFEK